MDSEQFDKVQLWRPHMTYAYSQLVDADNEYVFHILPHMTYGVDP